MDRDDYLLQTVFNLSKIQIESNSQRRYRDLPARLNCVQSFKDTNRKQFTTGWEFESEEK